MRYVCWLLVAAGACTPVDQVDPGGSKLSTVAIRNLGSELRDLALEATWIDRPVVPGLEPAWQLRSQRLRTYLQPDRLVMVDRAEAEPSWSVEMRLSRWGAPGAMTPVGPGVVHVDGPYFESRRAGIHEWVEARDEGIEHGFTLFQVHGSETVIDIEVEGAEVQPLEDGARLWTGRGAVDWRNLRVWDASMQPVPARVEGGGGLLRVTLDTSVAKLPITVDPLLVVSEQLITGGAGYGYALDLDGDRILVGDPGGNPADNSLLGRAVLHTRNNDTAADWGAPVADMLPYTTEAILPAFGHAVALHGSTAAVGGKPSTNQDTVQLFNFDETGPFPGWFPNGETMGSVTNGVSVYGVTAELESDLMLLGAPGSAGTGAYQLLVRDAEGVWTVGKTGFGTVGSRLGAAVDLDGNAGIVGAPLSNTALTLSVDQESVVSTTSLAGTAGTEFGASVAISGDWIAVGAPAGSEVSMYHLSDIGQTWSESQVIDAPALAGSRFGQTLALDGSHLVVTDYPASGIVKMHLYDYVGDTWDYAETIDIGPRGPVGSPVELSPSLLVAGVPGQSSVQVWAVDADTFVLNVQSSNPTTDATDGNFGNKLAIDGDQAAVAAPRDDTVGPEAGMVVMFERKEDFSWGFDAHESAGKQVNAIFYGPETGAWYGQSVALVNRSFVAIGMPHYDDSDINQGGVEVRGYAGTEWDKDFVVGRDATLISDDPRGGGHFGHSVAASGSRLLVGEPGRSDKVDRGGTAHIYERGDVAWVRAGWIGDGLAADDEMGDKVALSDEYALVGSQNAAARDGLVWVYGWDATAGVYDQLGEVAGAAGGNFGAAIVVKNDFVGIADDVNGAYIYRVGQRSLLEPLGPVGPVGGVGAEELAFDGDYLFVGFPTLDKVEVRRQNQGGKDAYGLISTLAGTVGSTFGSGVAADDGTLVVGAGDVVEGAVYFYDRTAEHIPPTARADAFTFVEDTSGTNSVGVLANDTDANDDVLTVAVVTAPGFDATFTLSSTTGVVTYKALANYCGPDAFTYRLSDADIETSDPLGAVTLAVTCVNDVPLATPFHADASETEVVVGSLWDLVDDSADSESDADLHYTTAPKAGTPAGLLTFDAATGEFTFASNVAGDFAYTYTVTDNGQPPDDLQADAATSELTFHVEHVPPQVNEPVTALLGEEDHQIHLPAPGLVDPEIVSSYFPLTVVIEDNVDHGRVDLGVAGDFHYYPDPNYFGPDTFTYRVSDGFPNGTSDVITLNLTVASVNDLPTGQPDGPNIGHEDVALQISKAALLVNDADVETAAPGLSVTLDLTQLPTHGTISENANAIVYTPEADWNGSDLLYYLIGDGEGESAPVAVSVVFLPENDAPTAEDLLFENVTGPVSGTVVATDKEGDPVTLSMVGAPSLGKLELEPDGAFVYTPFSGEVGLDSALVQPVDSHGKGGVPALVQFELLPGGGTTTDTDGTTPGPCEQVTYYPDADGDGYGNIEFSQLTCAPIDGWVLDNTDCDDLFADRYPGAREIAGDGFDQDCDGVDNTVAAAGGCGCDAGPGGSWAGAGWALGVVLLARRRGGSR